MIVVRVKRLWGAFLIFLVAGFILTIAHPDEVGKLPGLNFKLNFKHYSGYLNATSGRHLHYWFVESQRSPSKDPLLLWLNGGPGCSSLDGFLAELGPLHVSEDGKTLYENPYSWNRIANILFLEAPAGVGFSYADDKKYEHDDDSVSLDNYLALKHFFQKFPKFKSNDFYITGESYGGVYVPTLSVRVLNDSAGINFKGFTIGNGFLSAESFTNSLVFFSYYHGLIGKQTWNKLDKYCCDGPASKERCEFSRNLTFECLTMVYEVSKIAQHSRINVYNIYAECASSGSQTSRYSVDRRYFLKLLTLPAEHKTHHKSPIPCIDTENLRIWLNQAEVRKALHIPTFVQKWDICSLDVEFGYEKIYSTIRPQILQLIGSGKLRGMIYNGDVDIACNFLGSEWFADGLGLKVLKDYAPWIYDGQIAGFAKYYKNLTFLTVKGAGHMVPQDKPGPAYHMIKSFLSDTPLY